MSDLAPDRPELSPQPLDFPVVAVGASAGGLEAFTAFLAAINPEFPAAYILVQHLDPTHDSLLAELLVRHTSLSVTQIEDGTEVKQGHVYVIPSASGLTIEDGVLSLVDFEKPRGFRRPIDDFFQSLALDQGPNAAAVVLSGTGGDGTVGIRSIKEAGGASLVQDPEQAAYDGMPSSAINTGLIDFIERSEALPGSIERYFSARQRQRSEDQYNRQDFITRVLEAVREQTGHDFAYYKINTVLRRVQRRMQVLDITDPNRYAAVLETTPAEGDALFQDLLINVTAFFRDPEVFDTLRRDVIPQIVATAGPERPIRVWVPGCSSGEEPYSIAILFAEALSRLNVDEGSEPEVHIFATDIDEEMLTRARRAIYMPSTVADMAPELRERYFTASEDGFSVVPRIRDMVRVSPHSLIKDPPFSRLDLISCRNLLIYFDATLQSRVLPLFHYAMRPEGWLLLGSAENVTSREDLFTPFAREERIYRKVPHSHANFMLPITPRQKASPIVRASYPKTLKPHEVRDERTVRLSRRVMERYAPPHVVVDGDGRILHASARTAPYLSLSVGEPSMRLLDLAPSELRAALRAMLGTMRDRRRRIIRRGIEMAIDDDETLIVDLIADPLDASEIMIIFRETARRRTDEDDLDADIGDFRTEERISELEDELAETKGYLRTTVEELETSNEELKSSNEEMMSMNEELQSANEELSTVNEELKSKLDELAQVNADVVNFLESTQIATLFVDGRMRLRSFTPVARALFSLSEHDKGRPLLEVRTSLETERLKDAMDRILAGELRVTNRLEVNGASYNFSALPYRGTQGLLDGVVLVFEDISELVAAKEVTDEMEREVAAGQREIELLYQNAPIGMALVDAEHRYKRINDSLAAYNGVSPEDHLGRTITEVLPEIGAVLEPILDEVFNNKRFVRDHEIEVAVPTAPHQSDIFELDLYPVSDTVTGKVASAGIIARRITDARRLEADLRNAMNELQHRVKNSLATVLAVVSQTVRTTDDRKSLAEALTSRIGALASTHNLLTKAEWQAVDLRELVDQELAPYRHDQRITIEGAAMRLSPKAALTLTMVLHELVTNAAKYGPLADDGGSLEIVWRRRKDVFSLSWTEARSGEMTAPRRHGFGLRFIGRSLEHDLDGEAHFDWKPTGLACTITAPLRTICAPEGS